MEKWTLITSEDCVKCHSIAPFVRMSAEWKGIELSEFDFKDYEDKEAITTVPTLIVEKEDSKQYLTDEDLINYIRP